MRSLPKRLSTKGETQMKMVLLHHDGSLVYRFDSEEVELMVGTAEYLSQDPTKTTTVYAVFFYSAAKPTIAELQNVYNKFDTVAHPSSLYFMSVNLQDQANSSRAVKQFISSNMSLFDYDPLEKNECSQNNAKKNEKRPESRVQMLFKAQTFPLVPAALLLEKALNVDVGERYPKYQVCTTRSSPIVASEGSGTEPQQKKAQE